MNLTLEKIVEDPRGKIIFLKYGKKQINFVEIKKNYARGGHYHKTSTEHIIFSGKIEYWEEDINTGITTKKIIKSPHMLYVPAEHAHLLLALEDTLFIEIFENKYEATDYPKFRKIVLEKIGQS